MKIVIIGLGTIGKTILKSLSGKGHNMIIIDEDKDKIDALDAGADDYLTKPFSVSLWQRSARRSK